MQEFPWTALVTLIALVVYLFMGISVGRARARYDVPAPGMTGHPQFERFFRVQMNTLEWLPIFLPALWLFAFYRGDMLAAEIGAVWIVGRVLYMILYTRDPKSRSAGFLIQALAALALIIGAFMGVIHTLTTH